MTQSTQIDLERWADFCVTFSNGNKGRIVDIEVFGGGTGDNFLVDAAPLLGLDYSPQGKGDNFLISIGKDSVDFTHQVDTPVELWEAQADDGEVQALEIVDQHGVKTILSFRRY